ncbi:ester cyclase [Streptosporangium sp. NPDC023825]|uniref:ester cyclase n=1 Tax=Streptosporangium sp. NPDC023825 TaxID=3154909 RepID=UPI00342843C3
MPEPWELKDRLSEAINAHDLYQLLQHYSPDAVLISPMGMAEGQEQIAWFYEQFFKAFPDFHKTAWLEVAHGDPVVTEWTVTGTHMGPLLIPGGREVEGTGRRITMRASCAYHVANGVIIAQREYYDQLELYSQLGFGLIELDRPIV